MLKTTAALADGQIRRVSVVGASCSGKSTLSRRLARLLGVRHHELDAHYWGPEWSEPRREDFRCRVAALVGEEGWVIDGNYGVSQDLVLERAQLLIWLNHPFLTVWRRALGRTLGRAFSGEELFGGNRETFGKAFFSRDSILLWVLRSYRPVRRKYRELLARCGEEGIPPLMLEVRGAEQADSLLSMLRCGRTD